VYLNVPAAGGVASKPRAILLGTIGAFEISGAAHHGGPVQLRYPVGRAVFTGAMSKSGMMSVSFVRISGDQSPKGGVIGLGEVGLETTTEDKDA